MLALALAGCSGDEADGDGEKSGEPTAAGTTTSAAPQVPTDAGFGRIVGRLEKRQRPKVLDAVTGIVDGWIDGAYVAGDYPRENFGDAFDGFTKDAARFARKQSGTMSNAGIGADLDAVGVRTRKVRVDVLAPKGRAVGATARVYLVLELEGKKDRTERISGRLVLTPSGKGWRIFGFDIERGETSGKGKRR